MKRVFIVGEPRNSFSQYSNMYLEKGNWEIVYAVNKADLIQFTGGEDVTPALYGSPQHKKTHNNLARDRHEQLIFKIARHLNIPMVGICRGGQFLNVMCGGSMWQDVDGHANGGHEVIDLITTDAFRVTSTHHQMMIPGSDAQLIAVAYESKWKEKCTQNGSSITVLSQRLANSQGDAEIVFYKDQKCLCFQPHPEFSGVPDLRDRFFKYIEEYLFQKPELEVA